MNKIELTIEEIKSFVDLLCLTYELASNRNRHDFLFEYCFYFASILKKLIPDSIVCALDGHYFIFYKDCYIDFRGIIEQDGNFLKIYPNSQSNLHLLDMIEDLEYERDYAECIGLADSQREQEFQKFEPKLLEVGQEYLNYLKMQQQRKRKIEQ